MKWLVYGHDGWIGHQITKLLSKKHQHIFYGRSRIDHESEVEEEIIETKPDRIICVAGRTHGPGFSSIDYLEQPHTLKINIRDNLYGPVVLANLCRKYGIHFTYLGTGCIFNYDDTHTVENEVGYLEKDRPNFFGSNYSIVKGFTDRIMKFYDNDLLNVRIRMPISNEVHPRNFITKITKYEKICSIKNSMTVLPTLLPIMIDMSRNNMTGTINLTNPGGITHNEILDMYKEIVDPEFTYQNFTLEEQSKILLSERSNNILDTTKLETLYPNVKPIKEAVREVLVKMKKSL